MPGMPLTVVSANQAANISPALVWGNSNLSEEPLLSADAVAVVINRKDSQEKLTGLNNEESLCSGLRSLNFTSDYLRGSHWIPLHVVVTTS